MSVSITTLIENNSGEHLALKHEHGISFHIEKEGHSLLFDTSQSGALIENADQLRIDLSTLEYVILSHGHYDHSGGLRPLTAIAERFTLVMGAGFFDPKYAARNGCHDYLGNNFTEGYLKEKRIAYLFTDSPIMEPVPGVFIFGRFPRVHADEVVNPRFVIRKNGSFVNDPFDDEILVAVDTPRGMVVILGCSHPGMKNMIDAVRERTGRPIYAVLGGTHLVEAQGENLEKSLSFLSDGGIGIIGISHCTGKEAIGRLQSSCGRFFHNVTGSTLFVE